MIQLPPEQYYASLARKRMAAGVLLFDASDQLLILKPSYKTVWTIPGGTTDANESPRATAIRETQEEIGLLLSEVALVCVHYTKENLPRTESLQFMFSGGKLSETDIQQIKLQEDEIEEFKFVSVAEAISLLEVNLNFRLSASVAAMKSGATAYLES